MNYKFLSSSVDKENIFLPESSKINTYLKKSNYTEIVKAVDFIASDDKILYVHGFLGTGKRQFINYITEFLDKDVIKLEYYCKHSTVCDDILLSFIDKLEKNAPQNNNINAKITTLVIKFEQLISLANKPIVIILHSFDDISDENSALVSSCFEKFADYENIKTIISTRATLQGLLGEKKIDRQVFLKAFTKNIFKEFLQASDIECKETTFEDFYKYTRGYYYYTALAIKIIQAMKLSLNEFLEKFALSGMSFDSYLGITYINLIPATIRNFFWFLRTVRHGMTYNALASLELFDDFSVEYLKNNLMIFVTDDTIYVQDYFYQNIDISIPSKTEVKLHKYIIGIYEKELKEPLQTRSIMISRQALRQEIEYHNECINKIVQKDKNDTCETEIIEKTSEKETADTAPSQDSGLDTMLSKAKNLADENKNTEAIEIYQKILEEGSPDTLTSYDIKVALARLYKNIGEYSTSQHYYENVENFYKQNNEVINLNYLYYELTDLYFAMYKNERAIETAKKVIYSVDTPQSLMVDACTLLGNIYSSVDNAEEAYKYYQKAIESLDENSSEDTVAELYFKYALANDDKGKTDIAFEYYTRCISLFNNSPYKAMAYSNLGSCYFENNNYSDAADCFEKAYNIEKSANNYDGIYYNSLYLAKIYSKGDSDKALEFYKEAKQSAEFLNEDFYILEATVALGDFYYNNKKLNKEALKEYFSAQKTALRLGDSVDISKITQRIQDMKLRMEEKDFSEIENIYG